MIGSLNTMIQYHTLCGDAYKVLALYCSIVGVRFECDIFEATSGLSKEQKDEFNYLVFFAQCAGTFSKCPMLRLNGLVGCPEVRKILILRACLSLHQLRSRLRDGNHQSDIAPRIKRLEDLLKKLERQ